LGGQEGPLLFTWESYYVRPGRVILIDTYAAADVDGTMSSDQKSYTLVW